jgi:hypothetical protein
VRIGDTVKLSQWFIDKECSGSPDHRQWAEEYRAKVNSIMDNIVAVESIYNNDDKELSWWHLDRLEVVA